jgi:hypothetical protein
VCGAVLNSLADRFTQVFLLNLGTAGRDDGLKKLAQELGHSQRSLVAEPCSGTELYVIPKCEQAKILMPHGKLERGLLGVLIAKVSKSAVLKRHREPDSSVAVEPPSKHAAAFAAHAFSSDAASRSHASVLAAPAAPPPPSQPPPPPGAPPTVPAQAAEAPSSDDQMALALASLLAGGDASALAGKWNLCACMQHTRLGVATHPPRSREERAPP